MLGNELLCWSEVLSAFHKHGYSEVYLKAIARQNLVPGRRIGKLWHTEPGEWERVLAILAQPKASHLELLYGYMLERNKADDERYDREQAKYKAQESKTVLEMSVDEMDAAAEENAAEAKQIETWGVTNIGLSLGGGVGQ